MQRRDPITIGEYYHIFNRGVEKRQIFKHQKDYAHFIESLVFFNTKKPCRNHHNKPLSDEDRPRKEDWMVDIVAYCLNPNHFHFILKERQENGVATFMKKICTGYAMYFNKKNERSGVLFQGRFKSVHISSNDLLLYLSAYVNCNSQIHKIENAENYPWCSFPEYLGNGNDICQKDIIDNQFKNPKEYKSFCMEKVIGMEERKEMERFILE